MRAIAFAAVLFLLLVSPASAYRNPTAGREVALIDGTRLCVAGYSSGAHPALLTALNGSVGRLRCPVAYYGFLTAGLPQLPPTTYLRATSIPVLVTKAGHDVPGLNRTIDRFVAKARQVRAPVELLVHATAPHAFDVTQHDERSREIMRRTLAFLRLHLLRTT